MNNYHLTDYFVDFVSTIFRFSLSLVIYFNREIDEIKAN